MKSAIVTGATGFIGAHLCEELINNEIEVTALVRAESIKNTRLPNRIKRIACGMDEYDNLECNSADVFYHLAWEGATGAGRDDELLQVKNISRTLAALKAAKRIGCKRFVAMGTVYEKLLPQILKENTHRKADFYLIAKNSAHDLCLKLSQKLDIEFVWVTIFQPIGRYIKPDQMMAYAIDGLIKGEAPMFGPGKEPYDITAVEDIALGLRLLGASNLSKSEYYVGSGSPRIMSEYLKEAKETIGSDTELLINARPDDGLRFSFEWFDISDLQRDTGYSAKVSFVKAVQNVVEWVKTI